MANGWTGVGPALADGRHLFACSQPNCYRRLTFKTLEAAQSEEANHKCPYWGGDTKVSWSVTKTLVEQMWAKLDLSMDLIRDPTQGDEIKRDEKIRARAIAECIAVFMPPFFSTANEVAQEALKRHAARLAGDAEYETPGIGARRYEGALRAAEQHASAAAGWYSTPDGGYTSDPEQAGAKATRTTGRARTHAAAQVEIKLNEQEQNGIREAHKQMPTVFTAKVLAKNYGVSEAVVNAVLQA